MARRPPWNWRRIMYGPTMKAKGVTPGTANSSVRFQVRYD